MTPEWKLHTTQEVKEHDKIILQTRQEVNQHYKMIIVATILGYTHIRHNVYCTNNKGTCPSEQYTNIYYVHTQKRLIDYLSIYL